MKFFAVLIFAFSFTFTAIYLQEHADTPAIAQQVSEAKPVRVYMIYDPKDDKWFRENLAGFSSWGDQQQAEVWAVKKDAEGKLSIMFGPRAKRCKIKAFVLLAVQKG